MVGTKVFAYTIGGDVVIKLPVPRVEELSRRPDASYLVIGRRVMKEWVVIQREDPHAYRDHLRLFEAAMAFAGC